MSKNKQPTIIFTGGGSAGHVTPNLALIKRCQQDNWQIAYIGSTNGIEKQIIERINIPYYGIATGKLRRYFSWQNFIDPFKILIGILQAICICWKLKPKVIFSKGGFVAFPVVFAAWLNRIPVICHESDLTPGFANRLSFPFAKLICVTFAETKKHFKDQQKVIETGTPIRDSLLKGDANKGRAFCNFTSGKPIILVTGGGLGADPINFAIRAALPSLLNDFQIVHLCGKNKTDPKFDNMEGYKQFDYINEEMADLFACADLVISRAGANAIYEIIVLRKPNLLIPLSKKASRGDQILNAHYCQKLGLSEILLEENLTEQALVEKLQILLKNKSNYIDNLTKHQLPDSVNTIYNILYRFYL